MCFTHEISPKHCIQAGFASNEEIKMQKFKFIHTDIASIFSVVHIQLFKVYNQILLEVNTCTYDRQNYLLWPLNSPSCLTETAFILSLGLSMYYCSFGCGCKDSLLLILLYFVFIFVDLGSVYQLMLISCNLLHQCHNVYFAIFHELCPFNKYCWTLRPFTDITDCLSLCQSNVMFYLSGFSLLWVITVMSLCVMCMFFQDNHCIM